MIPLKTNPPTLTADLLNQLTRAVASGNFEVGDDGIAYALAGDAWVPEDVALALTGASVHVLDVEPWENGAEATVLVSPGGDTWVQSSAILVPGRDGRLVVWSDPTAWMGDEMLDACTLAAQLDEDFDLVQFAGEVVAAINAHGVA